MDIFPLKNVRVSRAIQIHIAAGVADDLPAMELIVLRRWGTEQYYTAFKQHLGASMAFRIRQTVPVLEWLPKRNRWPAILVIVVAPIASYVVTVAVMSANYSESC